MNRPLAALLERVDPTLEQVVREQRLQIALAAGVKLDRVKIAIEGRPFSDRRAFPQA